MIIVIKNKFMKKIIFLSLLIIIPLVLTACSEKEQSILLFVSEDCGHCAKVKQHISDNNISAYVEYTEIQAYEAQENYNLFNEKATECGFPENQRGVPMVYEKGVCEIGSPDVISFFDKKVK